MPVMNMTLPASPNTAATNPLLAQAQQIQIQQALAASLLQQGMQPYSTSIHTGGNNPFAVDIPNIAGPIGQLADAYFGTKKLNQITSEQQALAELFHQQQVQDISGTMQALSGGTAQVPGPDGNPLQMPPDPLQAAKLALSSNVPAVQDLGKSLMAAWVEGQEKSIVTPENAGTLTRNITAPSFASSIVPGIFGNTIDPSKWTNKASVVQGPGGALATVAPVPGAVAQGAGILAPTTAPLVGAGAPLPPYTKAGAIPQPGVAGVPADTGGTPAGSSPPEAAGTTASQSSAMYPGATPQKDFDANIKLLTTQAANAGTPGTAGTNLTSAPVTVDDQGNIVALKTPQTAAQEAVAKTTQESLGAQKTTSQNFINFLPQLQTALALIPKVNFGMGGQVVQDAQRALVALGASPATAAKLNDSIGATQIYLKTLLQTAIPLTHEINSRAASQMLNQVLTSVAASPEVSPQAAKTIVTNIILNGFNDYAKLKHNIVQASALPQIGPQQAASYDVPNFPTFYSTLQNTDSEGTHFHVSYNPQTGLLRNVDDLGPISLTSAGAGAPQYTPAQLATRATLGLK